MTKNAKALKYCFTLILALIALEGCTLEPGELSGERSYVISPYIKVHKTSAHVYTLCDNEGFGIVNGNVTTISRTRTGDFLIVGYKPFGSDATSDQMESSALKFSKVALDASSSLSIDIENADVQKMSLIGEWLKANAVVED